ncbi:hypothetical protein N7471_002433, partial [Penicillium samsonianum]|uniref:uncharacterized protein n=1 Tax=Penicillium samsonianum TaxID=1882272 RepID=UPI002548D8C4
DDIPTLIRFFNEGNRPNLYQLNAFGSFLLNSSDSGDFIFSFTLIALTDSYFIHCPKAAQPIVTLLGVVLKRGGQLNYVYKSSSRTYHTFPVTIYFKNGQRWANFPPLNINTHVFLTGRIFGVTKENR